MKTFFLRVNRFFLILLFAQTLADCGTRTSSNLRRSEDSSNGVDGVGSVNPPAVSSANPETNPLTKDSEGLSEPTDRIEPVPGLSATEETNRKNCPAALIYQQTINGLIQGRCLSCHRVGGPGSGQFSLKGPNPTVDEVWLNRKQILSKLNLNDIDQSKLLAMIANVNGTHPGGEVIAKSSAEWTTLKSWANGEAACAAQDVVTNLTRGSGSALTMRFKQLFPGAGSDIINDDTFDIYRARSIDRAIADTSRPFSAVMMIVLRGKVNALCKTAIDETDSKSNLFKFGPNSLRTGETAPADPAQRLAFAAARNAWAYPHALQSPEVQVLVQVYKATVASGAGTLVARQAVCVTALMAPQFIFGNLGDADHVRRMSIEVGRRLPTMADYEAYEEAKDKVSFFASYAKDLQIKGDGYLANLETWHRDWLGLRDFLVLTTIPPTVRNGFGGSPSFLAATGITPVPATASGFTDLRTIEKLYLFNRGYDFSESCTAGKSQNFDPRTIKILWQQFNPVTNTYEIIGGWDKSSGSWQKVAGSITLANGSKLATDVDDVTATKADAAGLNFYQDGKLRGTPLDGFGGGSKPGVGQRTRIVRRYSPSGEQDGYSTVKLYWSNEQVHVCNTSSRYITTCFYRPANAANLPLQDSAITTWNAGDKGTGPIASLRDSMVTPPVLDAFRCGIPNDDAIMLAGAPNYSEDAAYPTPTGSSALGANDLNEIAFNTADFYNPGGTAAEDLALNRLTNDLARESLNLVNDTVVNNRDFRLILTAPYTFGRRELEMFYRTQNYNLPLYLGGVGPAEEPLARIDQSSLAPIPTQLQARTTQKFTTTTPPNPPKQMLGLLTQPSFLGPVSTTGGKVRTLAARIFTRLLCGMPSEFLGDLDQKAVQLHTSFVPLKENASALHLDPAAGCYSCHILLDPLASVLNPDFASNTSSQSTGELKMAPYTLNRFRGTYGVRTGTKQGVGAVFGEKVTGLAEMANVLANSKQFSRCVVKTGFINVFGRQPQTSDQALIDQVTAEFRGPLKYNFNDMIQTLVTSPNYLRSN